MPPEYIELLQCEMYGCTPNELDDIPNETVQTHWWMQQQATKFKEKNKKK